MKQWQIQLSTTIIIAVGPIFPTNANEISSADARLVLRASVGLEKLPQIDEDTDPATKHTEHQWDSGKVTKAATCAATGVKTYTCTVCKTTKTETIAKTTTHKWDAGKITKEATTTTTGVKTYTCTVCKKTKTETIPVLEQEEIPDNCFEITYYLYGGQDYLKKIEVKNPNPAYYDSAKGLTLKNLSVEGYTFNGWYDSEGGEDSARIKSIPKGTEGEIELFARWTPRIYEVTLDYDFGEVKKDSYTFGEDYSLPETPKRDGYRFISWTDKEDGRVYKKIPAGTTGKKYYYANWLSNRNQAWQKKTLDDPLITEFNDVILFAYEIGEIKNVPLDVIKDFGYTMESGVKMEVSESYSASISKEQMDSFSSTVAKSTTNSFAWTLSNEWAESVSIDSEWMEQNGYTQEEAERLCQNETNNWYTSTTSFNSWDKETLGSTETHDLTTTKDNTKEYNSTDVTDFWKNSAQLEAGVSLTAQVGNDTLANKVSGTVSVKDTFAGEEGNTILAKSGIERDDGRVIDKGTIKMSGNNTTKHGGFNTETGNNISKSVSQEKAISTAISQLIASTNSYGEEYINKNGSSQNQGFTNNSSESNEFASSVTYSTATTTAKSVTWTINNTRSGCHRYILAGTAHVYGIVGYDIAKQTYFTYTFSVIDDERHMMEDYAPQPEDLYHDHEFSGITFEIPDEIADYVENRICATEGLEISEAGIVTNYTGSSQIVIVPEYISYLNKNGTRKAVKVVGISETAFRNPANITNIGAIQLPKTVTALPAHAFDGCASLIYVEAQGLNNIGESAFANCASLHVCNISDNITSLGAYVFDGMDSITVNAANASVAKAALQSGVKEIHLTISEKCTDLNDCTLVVPSSTTSFTFDGNDKTFSNLRIESNAANTIISNATFTSTGQTPLQIASPTVEIGQVKVNAKGIALALTAASTKLSLYGESTLNSDNGKALLCKSVTVSRDPESKNTTELKINNGNVLLYGTLTDNGLLKGADGKALTGEKTENISAQDFENYLKGVVHISLDANGGTVSGSSLECVYGTEIGKLPTPKRNYYTFVGWYTDAKKGAKVTSSTTCSTDMTLYAHWKENSVSDWVKRSEMPSGGKVVSQKWTYTQREYTTSADPIMSGWTQYDATSEWSDYGPWSDWSRTAVTGDDDGQKKVETKDVPAEYKTQYNYSRYYHYDGKILTTGPWKGTWSGVYCESYKEKGWSDNKLTQYSTQSAGGKQFGMYGKKGDAWYNETTRKVQTAAAYTLYRYCERSLINTYYFYQDENKEANSYPTGNDISNIVEWVQYKAK